MTAKSKSTAVLATVGLLGAGYLWGQVTKGNPDAVSGPASNYGNQLVQVVHTGSNIGGQVLGEAGNLAGGLGKAASGAGAALDPNGVPAAPQAGK